jgi:hypothetical protein
MKEFTQLNLLHHSADKSPKIGRFISGMATLPRAFEMSKGVNRKSNIVCYLLGFLLLFFTLLIMRTLFRLIFVIDEPMTNTDEKDSRKAEVIEMFKRSFTKVMDQHKKCNSNGADASADTSAGAGAGASADTSAGAGAGADDSDDDE